MNVYSEYDGGLALPLVAQFRRYAVQSLAKWLLLLCEVFLLSGCGTWAARVGRGELTDEFWPVYPATYCDVGFASAPFRPMDEVSNGKRAGMCVIGILDFPISVATDTLLLPYDICVSGDR